jgi:hypothetical protein
VLPVVLILSFFAGFASQLGAALLIGCIAAYLILTIFQLITLPVEFDASKRAKAELVSVGILGRDELPGVNQTLDAAALTYVAAFISSLATLLYYVLILLGRRDE